MTQTHMYVTLLVPTLLWLCASGCQHRDTPYQSERAARLELVRQRIPFTREAYLHANSSSNHLVLTLFRQAGYDPRSPLSMQNMLSHFYWAVCVNELTLVREELARGADVNRIEGIQQMTPLMVACERGNIDTVKVLLKSGADPNLVKMYKESDGKEYPVYSPLICACSADHNARQIVRLLLEQGARTSGKEGVEALTAAIHWCIDDKTCETIIKELVSNGANLQATNREGQVVLDIAHARKSLKVQ